MKALCAGLAAALLLATPAAATSGLGDGGDSDARGGSKKIGRAEADKVVKKIVGQHQVSPGIVAGFMKDISKLTAEQAEETAELLKKREGKNAPSSEDVKLAAAAAGGGGGHARDRDGNVVAGENILMGGMAAAIANNAQPPSPGELNIDRKLAQSIPQGNPAFGEAQKAMAIQDQHAGNHRAALPYFETAMDNGHDDARTLTFASLSALNAGDPRKAAAWAAQALEKDPGGPMHEQAEAISKMALKRLPKEEDPFAKRPPTRSREDDAATSVPELERPLPPRDVQHNLPAEARAIFAETNRLVSLASKAYRSNDIKEALKLSNEALAKDPDDVRALQVRAAANAKEGNWEEARKDADKGLDMAPGYVPLLLLRAAAAAHAKDWRSVKADAQSVLTKEKSNATAWRFRGIAEAGLGAKQDAIASLSRATQYGDHESARLLSTLRSLPPSADVVDLVEMLSGASASREAATDARSAPAAAPAPSPGRGNKTYLVFGAAILAGLIAGGVILLAGRRDEESS